MSFLRPCLVENLPKTMSQEFKAGNKVRLVTLPPYIKTADPMPMLRPANLLQIAEEGTILESRPGGYWSVRFSKGAFLIDSQYLEAVEMPVDSDPSS